MELNDETPQQISQNRSFLGIRRESGALRRMMEQQMRREVSLGSSMNALMPDGGLSPCVIKVLGVGGGGSNAVSFGIVVLLLLQIGNLVFRQLVRGDS